MDKKKPTYQLHKIRSLAKKGAYKATVTAQQTAHALGFSLSEIGDVIATLESQDFYKSVNEYRNHTIWQDVYRPTVHEIPLYIKVKIIERDGQYLLVLSFKEQ